MAQPPSKIGRIARLGGLTSRVSGSYLGQRILGAFQDEETREASLRKLHLENAEKVVETMGALKGAAMKVGQSIALMADGMDLPADVTRVLSKLHDRAEPVPFADIQRAIERELSAEQRSQFEHIDPTPLGTASLAQAHAAFLTDGTPVVIKVLHEGVEHSVDTDLGALKALLVSGRVLRRDREELDAVFEEIRDRLNEELDYYQEAANMEQLRRGLAGVEGLSVPRTYPELCTGRVLTMDRLDGLPLERFLESATPAARQRAGNLLVRGFHEMFYRMRALHADPHGGNYLFRSDGGVGLLDFGCVKRFDVDWVADYARMALSIINQDRPRFLEASRHLGTLASAEPEAESLLWELGGAIVGPLCMPYYRCGIPSDDVMDRVNKLAPRVIRRTDVRSPRNLVFLHRALGGIYAMLRKLGHEADYGTFVRPYIAHGIGVSELRVPDGAPVTAHFRVA